MGKRGYLSDSEYRNMLIAQHGLCAAASCMSEGPFEADHSTPNALKAGKPDQLLCVPCHRKKTFGLMGDVSKIAKAKRIAEGRTQHDRRLAKGSQLKSRGFDKTKTRGFDGKIRERT